MSYQVLARKYRPQRFSDVIGQDHVTRTLKNAIEQQRIAHGYIFSGHRGIGKTTVARILAMALNCRKGDGPTIEPCGVCESCTEIRAGNSVDVIEIDAATNRGIDEIRELREAARYRPARDRYKIYILDEAHQITDAAFNALLKTLEEPPAHIVFMMATTQPEDIPQTIRSRCQHFNFHAVRFDDIVGQLRDVARQENIAVEDEALAVIAEAGDGSMRDALSIMDQALAGGTAAAKVTAEAVRGLVGTVSSEVLEKLMGYVAADSSPEVLQLIDKLVSEGQSPTHFTRQLVRFLRNALVAKVSGADSSLLQISQDERTRVGRVAEQFSEEDLTRFLNIALRTHDELSYKSEQRFHLELGILKMVHAQRMLPLEQLLSLQPLPGRTVTPRAVSPAVTKPLASVAPAPSAPRVSEKEKEAAASPFESDRARKGRSFEMSSGPAVAMAESSVKSTVLATAAAMATAIAIAEEKSSAEAVAAPVNDVSADVLRAAVLSALEESSQGMLANMLEGGEWTLAENVLTIKVSASAVMIDMSLGPEPKKAVVAAASRAAGRAIKVNVISGGTASAVPAPHRSTSRATSSGSARNRAADDPLVQYMQEKFKAEIRTVIDHQKKD